MPVRNQRSKRSTFVRILIIEDEKKVANALREDIEKDLVTHKVSRGTRSLDLTTKEFDLLEYLLRHSDRVVSREMLARDVWHAIARATPLDNVIDVTIARLRRKIDEPYERKLLHTVRGLGYLLSGRQG